MVMRSSMRAEPSSRRHAIPRFVPIATTYWGCEVRSASLHMASGTRRERVGHPGARRRSGGQMRRPVLGIGSCLDRNFGTLATRVSDRRDTSWRPSPYWGALQLDYAPRRGSASSSAAASITPAFNLGSRHAPCLPVPSLSACGCCARFHAGLGPTRTPSVASSFIWSSLQSSSANGANRLGLGVTRCCPASTHLRRPGRFDAAGFPTVDASVWQVLNNCSLALPYSSVNRALASRKALKYRVSYTSGVLWGRRGPSRNVTIHLLHPRANRTPWIQVLRPCVFPSHGRKNWGKVVDGQHTGQAGTPATDGSLE